ncbi:MAG: DNA cytosine methyltransferase [Okeania sp. SIO2C2]|uniref:DNA cytosine methyltransferase n=1 Tax=Okeania sp. SIO2C2 TaxID=2607787 RepID=UPI0013BAC9CB|nr:DNA cytosine methyltransferase [Okeania sp. SIO2C2]NEP86013.1 DNA cytosine methyltransferase [Okeania sp. SIO2C2]
MNYIEKINHLLKPSVNRTNLVIDLFAGCGGLSLGFEAHKFQTYGFEIDADCCATYNKNLKGNCTKITLSSETELPPANVIIGGPPCQPFSVGGKQKGLQDSRDGFPIFINAVAKLKPEIWLFENVRGLLYRNKWYLDEITQALQSLGYIIEVKLLNAVDFGVPQNRQRVIFIGHKGEFKFPQVLDKKVTVGEALGAMAFHGLPESKFLTPNMDKYVEKYEKASSCKQPHDLYLDKPARTLTCRNISAPTGDMHRIKLSDGRRRRLLLREAARLQSFPDWFEFVGKETSCFNQIGNAVPPLFAFHLAGSIRSYLESGKRFSPEEISQKIMPVQLSLPF